MNPPKHVIVLCANEKTAIQARRTGFDTVLSLSSGRSETHYFEYFRHAPLSLYAVLDVQTAKVLGKIAQRHTSAEVISFLKHVVAEIPAE